MSSPPDFRFPDFEVDRRGRLTHVGPGVERATGRAASEIEGRWVGRLLHTRHVAGLQTQIEMRRDHPADWHRFDFHLNHADGAHRLVTLETRLSFDSVGRFTGATGRVVHASDDAQQADADFFGGLAARYAGDSVIVTEAEPMSRPGPRILYVNEAVCKASGYTRDELIGQTPRIFQGPDTDRAALGRIRHALHRWEPVTEELCNYRKDGSRFWVELSITPVADSGGYYTHWVAVQRDISERKRLEEELQATQTRFQDLVVNLPAAVYRRLPDAGGTALYLSERFTELTGHPLAGFDGAGGESLTQLLHPDDVRPTIHQIRQSIRTSSGYDLTYRARHVDGSYRWVNDKGRPKMDDSGRVVHMDGVLFDVTDRVLADERLRILEAAVQDATESILITDATPRGEIVFANQGFERMTGYSAEDVIGQTPRLLQGPDTDPAVIDRLRANLRDGDNFFGETINYRKDGMPFDIEWSISSVADASGATAHYVAVQRDITMRKRTERRLRVLEKAVEGAQDAVLIARTRSGTLPVTTYVNTAFRTMNGFSPGELVGKAIRLPTGPNTDSDQLERLHHLFATGTAGTVEGATYRKDGSEMWSEVSLAPVVIDEDTYWVVIQRDVTHMRRFEAEREARLRAEQMVRAKSVFFDNLSHEIRTPLTAILGAADVLASEVPPDQYEFAEMVQQGGERLLYTLDSFLDLARLESSREEVDRAEVALAPLVETIVRTHRPSAVRKGVALTVHCPVDLYAHTDGPTLSSALGHVVGNAVKFTDRGSITVDVEKNRDHVAIRVRDTGVGISPDFIPRLFDEFAQESDGLARTHEGNGLGLTIAHRLVGRIGGGIDVESVEEEGSTFTIAFPAEPTSR